MQTAVMQERMPAFVFDQMEGPIDEAASIAAGRTIRRIMDLIVFTPDSKTTVAYEVESYFKQKKIEVIMERYNGSWLDRYMATYSKWKQGEELPVDGTAIAFCTVFSKLQIKQLKEAGIRTVEELAEANEDRLTTIGMQARSYRDIARKWLENEDKSMSAKRLSETEIENQQMKEQIAKMADKMREMELSLKANKK